MASLKPGVRFVHARLIHLDRSPMEFVITRVASGWMYYAYGPGQKAVYKYPLDRAAEIVREVRA